MPKVLVAEDDPALRSSLRDSLDFLGFEVTTAEDAGEAAALLAKVDFDVVLSDVQMPGNGLSLVTKARRLRPRTPVVLITAYPSTQSRRIAFREGVFAFLEKPVSLGQLRRTLALAIGA